MPAYDRGEFHENESRPPVFPPLRQENPEETVALAKPGAFNASPENHELMPEGEVLKGEFGAE